MQQIMLASLPGSIEDPVGYLLEWEPSVSAGGTFGLPGKGGLQTSEAVQAHMCSRSHPANPMLEGVVPVTPCIACCNELGSL